jgi:hypothetical protein
MKWQFKPAANNGEGVHLDLARPHNAEGVYHFSPPCNLTPGGIVGIADRDAKKGPPLLASAISVNAASKCADADVIHAGRRGDPACAGRWNEKIPIQPCAARPRDEMRMLNFLRDIS